MQLNLFQAPERQLQIAKQEQQRKEKRFECDPQALSGKTIKEQLRALSLIACGDEPGDWFSFESICESRGYDLIDARDGWIELPEYLRQNICEMFGLVEFPVNPAPMQKPDPGKSWFDWVMEQPEASEHILQRPKDCYISLRSYDGKERYVMGPYRSSFADRMPMDERKEFVDFWRSKPELASCMAFDENEEEKARRKLSPEKRLRISKRNAMKRIIKRYGMLADQFIAREYQAKGWQWTAEDDALWAQEQAKAAKPAAPKKKRKQKGRSTDNDELLAR